MALIETRTEPDRDAFDRLVVEHYDSIARLVFRLLAWRDGGEDIVQEVFLSAWAARTRLSCPTGADLWLKRIALNKCRSRLRREAVCARWFKWLIAKTLQEPQVSPEDALDVEERASEVRRAIQSLDPRYREVTVLYYLEEMTVDEIAQVAGRRRNTIEVRLHRARRQLEQMLADKKESIIQRLLVAERMRRLPTTAKAAMTSLEAQLHRDEQVGRAAMTVLLSGDRRAKRLFGSSMQAAREDYVCVMQVFPNTIWAERAAGRLAALKP